MARVQKSKLDAKVEHLGNVAYVQLRGVIDESMAPKALAGSVKARTAVFNASGVQRISSFGLRQWMQFVKELDRRSVEVYFVECSASFVDQLGLVTGFAGNGKVFSLYAPYTCGQCGAHRSILFRSDVDDQVLRTASPPSYTCRVCEGEETLDEDPDAYFAFFSRQERIELPDEVRSLLQARLDYEGATHSARPHVQKHVSGDSTFVAIRGTLDATLPTDKIVGGLEGDIVVDTSGIVFIQRAGIDSWDEMVQQLLTLPGIKHVYFVGVPPLVLERGTILGHGEHSRLTLVSVNIPYTCTSCSAVSWSQMKLTSGAQAFDQDNMPTQKCADCGNQQRAVVGFSLLGLLNALPQAKVPRPVAKLITKAPKELAKEHSKSVDPIYRTARPTGLIAGVIGGLLVFAGGSVAVAYHFYQQRDAKTVVVTGPQNPQQPDNQTPKFVRPPWISSDQPGSATCYEDGGRVRCVGVSMYHRDKKAATVDARNAALEELAHLVALKSEAPSIRVQREQYWKERQDALAAAQEARDSGDTSFESKPLAALSRRRELVAESLQRSGGPAVPPQADHYWEEYDRTDGKGTEFMAFSLVEGNSATVETLATRYSETIEVGGARVTRAYPGLAWKYGAVVEGVFVESAGKGKLNAQGVHDYQVVIEHADEPVDSPERLKELLGKHGSTQTLSLAPTN